MVVHCAKRAGNILSNPLLPTDDFEVEFRDLGHCRHESDQHLRNAHRGNNDNRPCQQYKFCFHIATWVLFLQRDMPRCAMLERSTVEDSASDSLVLFSQDNGLGKSRLGSVVIKFSFYVTACRHIPVTFLFYNILWFSLKLLSEYLMVDIFWSLLRFRGCRGGASWVNFGNVLYVEPGRFSSNRASSPLVSVGRSYQTSYQDACVCV